MKDKFISAYMDVAERFAQLSHAQRAKVGAIIVKDDRIISIGYNGMPSGWDNVCETEGRTNPEVLHAETNAIAKLAQSGESGKDATLFCTHLPCMDCAKLIYQSGITHVYYREEYKAAKGSGKEFLTESGVTVARY
jgi:dCMP deaminase|tara:strand:+ start:88 stop:495 length:408 start_codon:yes stop_codon:yes gene_type:complete